MDDLRSHPRRPALRLHLLGACAMLGACQQPEVQNEPENALEEPVLNLPAVPRPQSLDRTAILTAVARAASAQTSGMDDTERQRTLDGRQFELRIRFGCRGPSNQLRDEWLGWSYDRESGTLRVRARPTLGGDDALVRELGGDQFEAVEGFWIPRPWLLESACPVTAAVRSAPTDAAPADAAPDASAAEPAADDSAAEPSQTISEPLPKWPRIGIAQFFTETDPRTGRRDMRPYEAVKTLDPAQPIGSQGFDLVLSGRLKALPGNRVIACVAKSSDSPPECVISADFDRVRIEKPDSREVIAEWGSG